MSLFSSLSALPPDALLGLMTAFRADPRPEKFDLGVGVYKDGAGRTPILAAVKEAEARLIAAQQTKVYEGPRGNTEFCSHIEDFVFGPGHPARAEGRVTSFTAPGGCGALFQGVSLMRRLGTRRVWVSRPTWPNHPNVVRSLGLETADYDYAAGGEFDLAGLLAALEAAAPGDGVILQGPCHNPTGIDPQTEDWRALGRFARTRRLIVMLDVAYHGFADTLEADMAGVRAFIAEAGEAMIAYSCSKNFGLYRERTGCFLLIGEDPAAMAATSSHVADNGRATWSMPPAHGAGIVATILGDRGLRASWEDEVAAMRRRMQALRARFAAALAAETGSTAPLRLVRQNGMFSMLPVSPAATAELRERHGVYMPVSGRINVAGLAEADIAPLARILAPYLAF